ncbi:hypothetical protein GIB67_011779 [Kingdonia uniflora]|uniref:Zinc finger GRF-type domain-containing protein n=1 Tax=Kingdonia uniflora TaxID=39325 RepID=A0A7J7NY24_9MAGN|nr:hypothetical protein GIB67_011779 [Kingdonia uniflora]
MVIYSCICGNGVTLISQSSDNPNKAYCKCLYTKTPRDCGFFCWVDEYLPCPCGNGPCKQRSATVNYEGKKYKTAPLQHRDLLEKLFDGLSATGDFAWSSSMISVSSSTQQSEYVPLPEDMNVDNTQAPLAGVYYPWDGEAIPSYDAPISPVREPTPGSTSRSRTPAPQSNRRRAATAVQPLEPAELVQSLISAFTAQGASHTFGSNDDTSDAVVQVLQEMVSSYEIDNKIFFKSLKFLG